MPSSPRRVLHVAPLLWSGAGEVITSLCEAQAESGPVAIVTAGRSAGERDWPNFRRRLSRAGIQHNRIDFFQRSCGVFWQGVTALRALVSEWRPHVLHAHAGVPACAAAAARRDAGFAIVSHVYSWGVGRPAWMDEMDLAGLRQSDVVICSSAAYEQRLLAGGVDRQRLVRLPWGLAPSTIKPEPRRLRSGAGSFGVGAVGRIEPRKGQLQLVRGLALARRRVPAATLDLVGPVADARYAGEVEEQVRRSGLTSVVRLRGLVRSVPRELARWDLFVSVSSDEGQGLAILEAMAAGVPVAARMVAGVEDYFRPGDTGLEVTSADPEDIARAIEQAFHERERLDREATRLAGRVRRAYAWDRLVSQVDRIYRGAVRCAAGAARRDSRGRRM